MKSVPKNNLDNAENGTLQHDSPTARALTILQTVAASGRATALSEICEQLQLPKATAHRLCSQLVEMSFLARDVDGRSYIVGRAMRALALNTLNHRSLQSLRQQVLRRLVKKVGETCNFNTLDGARVRYLDRVEAQWPLRLIFDVGSTVPLHCTSSGKLLLAHLPPAEAARIVPHLNLEATTPNTITDLEALERECRKIREQGYATDKEEFIEGMVAVAVPVRDSHGDVKAVVAMHAPSARVSLEKALEMLPHLNQAARELQSLL